MYASNAVNHIVSENAVSQAVRGHFLVNATLSILPISIIFDIDSSKVDEYDFETNKNLQECKKLLDAVLSDMENAIEYVLSAAILRKIDCLMNEKKRYTNFSVEQHVCGYNIKI